MKSKGHGWGVIAQSLGVHPGAFNKQRVALSKLSDDELAAAVWISLLTQAFSVPILQIVKLHQKGLGWGDIIAALQVSSASQVPPEKVLVVWQEACKDWDKARNRLGASPDWLPPFKAQEQPSSAPKGHGKGHGHGRKR